ncbi:hypothetical protein [Rhodococcus qingshengii]|uniref:hypothetical protein n=1 Tax=Rhodococcus qingshengii TaxID=334542 RepID=UPI001ADF84A6|nr:hypothetical protein [Rhodococcus qingshengii]MCQ4148697.1 hypothetical protein [Rhodococcus qingshengii]
MNSAPGKTGSGSRPWVVLDSPRPLPVVEVEDWWIDAPPQLSTRCEYWVRQIVRGWLPNRRIAGEGYYSSAIWYGVWIWEYLNVIYPLVATEREKMSA